MFKKITTFALAATVALGSFTIQPQQAQAGKGLGIGLGVGLVAGAMLAKSAQAHQQKKAAQQRAIARKKAAARQRAIARKKAAARQQAIARKKAAARKQAIAAKQQEAARQAALAAREAEAAKIAAAKQAEAQNIAGAQPELVEDTSRIDDTVRPTSVSSLAALATPLPQSKASLTDDFEPVEATAPVAETPATTTAAANDNSVGCKKYLPSAGLTITVPCGN